MTSQTGQQTITIHVLPNISRSKCNQTMKFRRLKKYCMSNTYFEKSDTKLDGKTIPRAFYLNPKIGNLECYKVCFYCMSKLSPTKIY